MSGKKTVELGFFVDKEFDLTAVSTGEAAVDDSYGRMENASTITFTLDGVTYQAVEDPNDGYRSSLGQLFIADNPPANRFPVQRVVAEWDETDNTSLVHFKSTASGMIVLSIGTSNHDDYYPCFVGSFDPKNMDVNRTDDIRQKIADEDAERAIQARRDAAGWGSF